MLRRWSKVISKLYSTFLHFQLQTPSSTTFKSKSIVNWSTQKRKSTVSQTRDQPENCRVKEIWNFVRQWNWIWWTLTQRFEIKLPFKVICAHGIIGWNKKAIYNLFVFSPSKKLKLQSQLKSQFTKVSSSSYDVQLNLLSSKLLEQMSTSCASWRHQRWLSHKKKVSS